MRNVTKRNQDEKVTTKTGESKDEPKTKLVRPKVVDWVVRNMRRTLATKQ
jgi:hypothetical protein